MYIIIIVQLAFLYNKLQFASISSEADSMTVSSDFEVFQKPNVSPNNTRW